MIIFINTWIRKVIKLETNITLTYHLYCQRIGFLFRLTTITNCEFCVLIGFTKKIVNKIEPGDDLPNITNSIDMIHINTDAIANSILNGVNTNTLAVIPTDNLTRSFPFTFEPRRLLFNEVSQLNISQMRFYITDSLGRPIGLNKIDWFMTLILRSTPV